VGLAVKVAIVSTALGWVASKILFECCYHLLTFWTEHWDVVVRNPGFVIGSPRFETWLSWQANLTDGFRVFAYLANKCWVNIIQQTTKASLHIVYNSYFKVIL
jgi:hypothetical protein